MPGLQGFKGRLILWEGNKRVAELPLPVQCDVDLQADEAGRLRVVFDRLPDSIYPDLFWWRGLDIGFEVEAGDRWVEPDNCRFRILDYGKDWSGGREWRHSFTGVTAPWWDAAQCVQYRAELIGNKSDGRWTPPHTMAGDMLIHFMQQGKQLKAAPLLNLPFSATHDVVGRNWIPSTYTWPVNYSMRDVLQDLTQRREVSWRGRGNNLYVWRYLPASQVARKEVDNYSGRDLTHRALIAPVRDYVSLSEEASLQTVVDAVVVRRHPDGTLGHAGLSAGAPTPNGKQVRVVEMPNSRYTTLGGVVTDNPGRFGQDYLVGLSNPSRRWQLEVPASAVTVPFRDYALGDWVNLRLPELRGQWGDQTLACVAELQARWDADEGWRITAVMDSAERLCWELRGSVTGV